MRTITTALLFLGLVAPVSLQARKPARPSLARGQLAAAEAYCKEVDSFTKENPKLRRIFGNVASLRKNTPEKWREFESLDEMEAVDTDNKLAENARVWVRNGKVIKAFFIFESSSRDWAQYVAYYFREDGSLVKTKETFNTFYANISAEKEKVYGPSGKLLLSSSQYFDLRTGQKKRPNGFASVRPAIYKKVRNLPFYQLL